MTFDQLPDEWKEWLDLQPLERFARSERMLVESTAMRGSLDPDPDPTRPFDVSDRFIAFAPRTGVDTDVSVASTRGA